MSAAVASFLTFLPGLALGNRLAIGRDERKEYNEAAAPIRGWLLSLQERPSLHKAWPAAQEIDHFVSYPHWWQRRPFLRHYASLEAAHTEAVSRNRRTGEVWHADDTRLQAMLGTLLPCTARR